MVSKQKQQASASTQPNGVWFIKTVSPAGQSSTKKVPDDCFKLFIFSGFMSLTGKSKNQCCETLVAHSPSSILGSIGRCFVPTPLHPIHVKSTLITGFFFCCCFPVNYINFILGNDSWGKNDSWGCWCPHYSVWTWWPGHLYIFAVSTD